MLRELQEHLISDTTELLVRPGISQRCIEEDVSLAGKDCLSVILGETQKECFSCSRCLFHYSCGKLAMLLGWCDLDWALRATKPLMPGIGHASLIVFALRALLARLKSIY